MLDLPAVAAMAHAHGLPLLVDSTFTTPWLCRPIEHGADIVVHSLTKWLGGHGVAIGGIVVDGGRFDWQAFGPVPDHDRALSRLCRRHLCEHFGPQAFAARARTEGLRDFGACLSPQNAFYLLLGIETLPLRMERHIANTAAVLEFLAGHPAVAYVVHPTRPDHPDHALASACCRKGAGSIVSFGVKGGRAAGARFIEACRLASHLANVGDAKTLVIHPASTTHLQLGEAQLAAVGLRDDMIRLSVGLEHAGDIVADLDRALRAAQKADEHGAPHSSPSYGQPHRSGARTVVLVHGAGMDHTVWALQGRHLAFHGWNVLAVDLPGHGRSRRCRRCRRSRRIADWLAELIAAHERSRGPGRSLDGGADRARDGGAPSATGSRRCVCWVRRRGCRYIPSSWRWRRRTTRRRSS